MLLFPSFITRESTYDVSRFSIEHVHHIDGGSPARVEVRNPCGIFHALVSNALPVLFGFGAGTGSGFIERTA